MVKVFDSNDDKMVENLITAAEKAYEEECLIHKDIDKETFTIGYTAGWFDLLEEMLVRKASKDADNMS